jgi:hypothetical protein
MAKKRPRLTSIGGFGFGAGWDWATTDGEVARRLVVFLEDRRALTQDHHREDVGYVVESVLRIREQLTKTLQELAPKSGADHSVRAMRDACLLFLDRVDGHQWAQPEFFVALGELRAVFAIYVRALAERYDIDVHGPLGGLLYAVGAPEELSEAAPGSPGET